MSDVVAAPAEAVAPSNASNEVPATPAAAPVDPRLELEAAFKKAGGLKFKAGGKEHSIDSLEKLTRYAQRGLPVEQSLEEVSRARAELEPMQRLLQQLQSGTEDEAESALEKLLDSGKLDKVAERRLRRQFDKEQSMAGMSPRERELAAQLEQERGEKGKLTAEREAFQKQQAEAQEAQQVQAIQNHMGSAIGEALKLMDLGDGRLDAMAVNFMKPIIRATLNAGQQLDPATLAERVGPMLDAMHKHQIKSAKTKPYMAEAVQEALKDADDATLLKFFGSDVGKAYRRALLGQLQGGSTPRSAAPAASGEAQAPGKWDPRRLY